MEEEEIYTDTYFVVQYQAEDSRQVTVTLDGEEIFNELVPPPQERPPLVFFKNVTTAGAHHVVVTDGKREKPVECEFTTPDNPTVLATIAENAEENDIEAYTKRIGFK